ncbi:hypothetical protein Q7M76_05185 [Candidatus Liberibacter asiaticus]|uniref:Uncharacterized protein n=2 Tax=Liberibacter asiaticus TaxID=34021 RepID=C6XGX4_LIBAP|nr:hypothetical protein [Candidatus Liberibacter asiaticus]AGH17388.1 hypothetical protein WSI_05155 [Candidatus Liberibacter asiaticus str. gxpsy]ACT57627.1 hypothetical protein CLIBASIA_05305 [Candidatus Liberibacter asiaticus str. psy62]ALK07664.1 hypothetical protein CD16_05150 [Candidatus Liberibacter asiaticus]ASK53159.1 hypothetical protein B2I23_05230 [Candidatus Liberibacter asiaticus]AWL14479.1 hypothetical protein DIC79_05250 [Candidatus Liberibacter asiaticus]
MTSWLKLQRDFGVVLIGDKAFNTYRSQLRILITDNLSALISSDKNITESGKEGIVKMDLSYVYTF